MSTQKTFSQNFRLFKISFALTLLTFLLAVLFGILTIPKTSFAAEFDNLDVNAASFLGGSGDDEITASEVAPDKTLILGGKISQKNFDLSPVQIQGGGDGIVLQVSSDGKNLLKILRFPSAVTDLDIAETGEIAVVGEFGLSFLKSDLSQEIFAKTLESGNKGQEIRVDIQGNKIATLNKTSVSLFDFSGNNLLLSGNFFQPSGKFATDLALTGDSIVVIGETQKDGAPCNQWRAAWMRSYNFTGNINWTNYDWDKNQVGNFCADAIATRVAMGRDGKLYFAGESAGGNTVFKKDPRDLSSNEVLVKNDLFNDPFNTASNHITFVARFDPITGNIDKGQILLSRLTSGKGNTIKPEAITANEEGEIFVVGASAAHFPDKLDRTKSSPYPVKQKINNQLIANYVGSEGFLIQISKDFQKRIHSAAWTGEAGISNLKAVSTRDGISVVAGSTQSGKMITFEALQNNSGGSQDGFFSTWGNLPQSSSSTSVSISSVSSTSQTSTSISNSFSSSQVSISSSSLSSNSNLSSVSFSSSQNFSSVSSSLNSSVFSSQISSSFSNQSSSLAQDSFSSSISSVSSTSQNSVFSSNFANSSISQNFSSISQNFSSTSNSVSNFSSSDFSQNSSSSNNLFSQNLELKLSPKTIQIGQKIDFLLQAKNLNFTENNLFCIFDLIDPSGKKAKIQVNFETQTQSCELSIAEQKIVFGQINALAQETISGELSGFNQVLGEGKVKVILTKNNQELATFSDIWKVENSQNPLQFLNVTVRTGGAAISLGILVLISLFSVWVYKNARQKFLPEKVKISNDK